MTIRHSPFSEALSMYYDEEYETEGLRTISDQLYLDQIKKSGKSNARVLELCCGTGRLAVQSAKAGAHVTAVDISTSMLNHFKQRLATEADASLKDKIELVEADINFLDLPDANYDFVFCGFNSFNLLGSKRLQLAALVIAEKYLAPAGVLAFDMRNPFKSYIGSMMPSTPVEKITKRGTFLQRVDRQSPLDDKHCQTVSGWYDETDHSGTLKRTPFSFEWCLTDKFEVKFMLREAGFDAVVVLGSSATDYSYFVTAKKPSKMSSSL